MLQVKIDIKSEEINNSNTVIASLLTIEVLFGEEKRRKITFDSRKDQVIRIGRIKNEETDIVFEDDDVSRKKLKLIIKQSKCLMEGKEIIINSLGLLNSKNNYNDGLTIFGDSNVINK